jgi:probable addiction module antidote protein
VNTIFIGGSRNVSRLSAQALERLNNVVDVKARVIVGDANGADKAVQRFLSEREYPSVIVFCSGAECRNNVGRWETRHIEAAKNAKGFDFYAAKDRVMAREADYGLMIWDGKSAGTILNILRLLNAGRKAVLINSAEKNATNFKTIGDWKNFYASCTPGLRDDIRKRATAEEWIEFEQPLQASFLEPDHESHDDERYGQDELSEEALAASLNAALATGNSAHVVQTLGTLARTRGMSQVAKDAGLARESLYRSLATSGNPEFATILRVLSSMGLRLVVRGTHSKDER